MLDYLLEIGTEEIPAVFIPPAAQYLKTEFRKQMTASGITFGDIAAGGTPRRLYLHIGSISPFQEDRSEIILGPPAKIAFLDDGSVSAVGLKFAESKALDPKSLTRVSTPKGDYLQGEKKTGGESAADILSRILPAIISSMPFGKSMKWGSSDFKFARPIHWFLSILDGKVLPFEINNIKASDYTFGHRFLAPDKIIVKNFEQYKKYLSDAYVIIDSADRREMIMESIRRFEEAESIKVITDEQLLETVSNLVEFPHPIKGSFEKTYLELPKEVLITSMKVHQKYFPVSDKNGNLRNEFVGVSNMKPKDDSLIRQGYERVLKARLYDALFFYNNDKNLPLEKMAEGLKKVVYQEKLGTIYEKVERFEKIASFLAEKFKKDKVASTIKTARLAKADLLSEMVYEFPELQGTMGSYYAKFEGNPEDICKAIFEHYLPRNAGDILPQTDEGRFVSIADKIDSIAGAFAAGMIPTGNLDPYGLRRLSIGILSIIEDSNMRLDLKELVDLSLSNFETRLKFDKAEVSIKVLNFINQRYKQILTTRGDMMPDIFDAIDGKTYDPIALRELGKVLSSARGSENFEIIAASFKRINNILKKNSWKKTDYRNELFAQDEEHALGNAIAVQHIESLIKAENNSAALDELLKFAPLVNAFFDKVMVMADDENIRANRLSLITKLRAVFLSVGNFDMISQ